ncbi:hypothetical protein [Nocardia sp. R6R-6]|uniref:hypothetical protein n=1 Tax=Nocardia sp. R6R-6 TaxID=3459303 RepID=UPI00403DB236
MFARRIVFLAAVAVATSACATSIPDRAAGSATTQQPPSSGAPPSLGVPGLPGKTDAGKAAGAPFRIPAFTELQGVPIVAVRDIAVQAIAEHCGHCVEVDIAKDKTDTLRSTCQYSSYRGAEADSKPTEKSPNGSLILIPGSTLTLLTGTLAPQKLPCGNEGFQPKETSETGSPTETGSPSRTVSPTATPTSKPRVTTTG